MRYITKSAEPSVLKNFKLENKSTPENLVYRNLTKEQKRQIKVALLKEQGHLCAYTMMSIITEESCHIEHLHPQNSYPTLDLIYENMLACVPKDGGEKYIKTSQGKFAGFGAPLKAGIDIKRDGQDWFVSPLYPDCETRLLFSNDGTVKARNSDDKDADLTITLLNLNAAILKEQRQAAIRAVGLPIRSRHNRPLSEKIISPKQAQILAKNVMKCNQQGKLTPFCTAIAQVALRYAQQEEARAQRMKINRNR